MGKRFWTPQLILFFVGVVSIAIGAFCGSLVGVIVTWLLM